MSTNYNFVHCWHKLAAFHAKLQPVKVTLKRHHQGSRQCKSICICNSGLLSKEHLIDGAPGLMIDVITVGIGLLYRVYDPTLIFCSKIKVLIHYIEKKLKPGGSSTNQA